MLIPADEIDVDKCRFQTIEVANQDLLPPSIAAIKADEFDAVSLRSAVGLIDPPCVKIVHIETPVDDDLRKFSKEFMEVVGRRVGSSINDEDSIPLPKIVSLFNRNLLGSLRYRGFSVRDNELCSRWRDNQISGVRSVKDAYPEGKMRLLIQRDFVNPWSFVNFHTHDPWYKNTPCYDLLFSEGDRGTWFPDDRDSSIENNCLYFTRPDPRIWTAQTISARCLLTTDARADMAAWHAVPVEQEAFEDEERRQAQIISFSCERN